MASYGYIPDLASFPSSTVVETRVFLFAISAFHESSQRVNATHTSPPAPSSATPSTSHGFHSFASSLLSSHDRRSSADAQAGIGLSLLQDLANRMGSLDEGEDEEEENRRRLRYSRWSVDSNGMHGR